jgi:hypothetical protein
MLSVIGAVDAAGETQRQMGPTDLIHHVRQAPSFICPRLSSPESPEYTLAYAGFCGRNTEGIVSLWSGASAIVHGARRPGKLVAESSNDRLNDC